MSRAAACRLAVAIAVMTAAPAVYAQGYVGLGGGGSLPLGPTAKSSALGWNALAFVGFGSPAIPLGVRFDGAFDRFQYKNNGPYENIWSGTANLVQPLAKGPLVPYLIGGIGYYEIQHPGPKLVALPPCALGGTCVGTTYYGTGASTGALGLNSGLGIRTWSGNTFGLFLEARFHYVFSRKPAQPFAPITFGITF